MPERPHRGDEPARPGGNPGPIGSPAPGRSADWCRPFEQGRPRKPATPWELARERYRAAENRPPRGSLADMKAQLEMLPPLDPSSPWNPDGTRRPKPPDPKDYELPLPSDLRSGPGGGTPSWLDLLPTGDRVMMPRPRQPGRHVHSPAESGRPPPGKPGTPAEVTHDDRLTPGPPAGPAEGTRTQDRDGGTAV